MKDKELHVHEEGCDCGCEHDHEHKEGCDCGCEDEIVELIDDNGRKLKFYHLGTIEYKGKYYVAFQAAEEIEGLDQNEMVIFELSGNDEETSALLPVEDEALLDEVYEEFCRALDDDECDDEDCDCHHHHND